MIVYKALSDIGDVADDDIDLIAASLLLSQSFFNDTALEYQKASDLFVRMSDSFAQLIISKTSKTDNLSTEERLSCLNHIFYEVFSFDGNRASYDDLDNADLVHVLNNRKGLPVSLAIIYIALAKTQGWIIEGLSFPGHFVVRLMGGKTPMIIDVFNQGSVLNAPDLRDILKQTMGEAAELSSAFYEPITNREILLRLQNNIKARLIRDEDYERALNVTHMMTAIAPEEERVLFDTGLLYFRLGHLKKAIAALSDYKERTDGIEDKQEAAYLIADIEALIT